MDLDPATRAAFLSSWSAMDRRQRRRALRSLGIWLAIDHLGACPAEVVLCLNGPTVEVDQAVRRSLGNCRDFFEARPCLSGTSSSSTL